MKRLTMMLAGVALLAACGSEPEEAAPEAVEAAPVEEAAPAEEALTPAATGPGAWTVDEEASSLIFTGRHETEDFTGRFGRFGATIVLDPENLADASIDAVIALRSADAGTADRNDSLPEPDWFDVVRYPRATFTSKDITRTGPQDYQAVGMLSMKGVDRPLTLPFTLVIEGDRATADASVTLDRTQFGVGTGAYGTPDIVANEVGVQIHIEADRAGGL